MKTNALYYGDNLDMLREHVPDEVVDLVYLDPPFNSNRDYKCRLVAPREHLCEAGQWNAKSMGQRPLCNGRDRRPSRFPVLVNALAYPDQERDFSSFHPQVSSQLPEGSPTSHVVLTLARGCHCCHRLRNEHSNRY